MALAKLLKAGPRSLINRREHQLAAAVLMRRARFVQRQAVHLRNARQTLDPERFELLVIIQKQAGIEPARVIDITQSHSRQVGWLAVLVREKSRFEISKQVLHRPTIRNDVVLGE